MGHFGDVIDELTIDHREFEEMFERIEALPVGDERRKTLADQVIVELVRHSVAEEMHLYPAVRRLLPNGGSVADKELGDHATAERVMKRLEHRDADDPEFDRLIAELTREIRGHVRDEEHNLFRRLRQAASAEELRELGDKVRHAKKRAPTHPHPHAPLRPPYNRVVAPGAGLVDRVRDALGGRGKS
ncbi:MULTISPECIES: hemerythrin domain-containing protein [Streptomyces]|uniref:Hemerythrin domain-containing protein n=1 Tax=Streptomyces lycii TaxID=2654337 RepID=A0ABQ7FNA3_9ACTN|nr:MULTISPECIES: hemerythrin domain-containing protein [Streptomyces]KAF4409114.1 hemerythrin domain-containing protein [Streptomyces lycii]PGH47492.1 hemerythrin [Streptomyces sp. Ru87]